MNRVGRLRMETNRQAMLVANDWEARTTPCFNIKAEGSSAKVYVYDVIGGWDLDASDFVQNIHALDVASIDMHINSPGGFVYDAVSMYEAVRSHPAKVITRVDGLAASAASFLAMAGDEVEIAKGGRMMIHDAQGIGMGSPADMREYADLLDEVSNDISQYYADRAGGKAVDWRAAMTATTWYSSSQAIDAGLADRISGGSEKESNLADFRSRLVKARAAVSLGGMQ